MGKDLNKTESVRDEAKSKPSVANMLFENLLTADELALDMGRSKLTVYKWVNKGLPKRRISGRIYFDAKEVAQWIQRTAKT